MRESNPAQQPFTILQPEPKDLFPGLNRKMTVATLDPKRVISLFDLRDDKIRR